MICRIGFSKIITLFLYIPNIYCMKTKLLLVTLLMTSVISFAQIIPEDVKPPSWNMTNLPNVKAHKLASFDLKKLQEEDIINDKNKSKPWRFGHDVYVDHDFNEVGVWTTLSNGDKIWRMSYYSENATSINFMFDVFKLPEGAKLYVYNDEKDDLLRPFTHNNNNPEEVLGTWLVTGDKAWIEYYEPANAVGEAKLTVGSVVHGYRTAVMYQKALNDSGSCNQDVDCDITPPGADPYDLDNVKEKIKRASAMLVTGSTGFCSGTLINNTSNDGTPYFMTANHCGGGEAGWAFRFNWRSPNPSCSTVASSPNGSFNQTVSGSILRANSSQSDMELVEITDASFFNTNPDVVWVGWNRSTTQVPALNFGIHHPSGDIQKVCRDDDGATRQTISFNGNANTQMWFISEWELGVTEQGSSGSGLFNQDGRLIGVLSGGAAACNGTSNNGQPDFYGRFGVAWSYGSSASSRLSDWLDPTNTGAVSIDYFPNYNNDASVVLASEGNNACYTEFTPEVALVNRGSLAINSATITYSLDGEPDTVVNWTGSLSNGSQVVVATPSYTDLAVGTHTFNISVSNPNGIADENTVNDVFTLDFDTAQSYTTTEVVFNITTDNYGYETTWQLLDSGNNIVANGPEVVYADNSTYQEIIAIPTLDECYTFSILDLQNDGICCFYGSGSYNLEDENGNVIISGGNFGNSESVTFTAKDALSIDDYSLENVVDFYPNPVNNNLNVIFNTINEDVRYEMFNALGQQMSKGTFNANTTSHSVNMSQYQSGVYFIKLTSGSRSLTQKIVKD